MTYGEIKNQTLRLLNQYSVAGRTVAAGYNNQADYIARIPGLVNDAVMEIAASVRKIPATVALSELEAEDLGRQVRYTLPEDFYQFKSGDTVRTADGRTVHTNSFTLQGRRYLLLPGEGRRAEAGEGTITYYRYPHLLPDTPADTDVPDNDPETHRALPYYAAAFLAAHDDPFLCQILNNKYEDLLQKLSPPLSAEVRVVTDVYGEGDGL